MAIRSRLYAAPTKYAASVIVVEALEARLPEAADGLHPAEDLLDALADSAGSPRSRDGASCARRSARPPSVTFCATCGVTLTLAAGGDEVAGVVALVAAERDAARADELRCRALSSASRRSAWPSACVDSKSTSRPLRFSISACAENESFGLLALALAASFASGSVVDSCVSFERFSPWKSTVGLPGSSGGVPRRLPSFFLKLLSDAHASISVPSTVKCSSAHQAARRRAWLDDRARRTAAATSCSSSRSRFLREHGRVEARLGHVHVEEPAKQQVVVELLAELPLAAHRVQRHQQRRLQQPLGRDRRPPACRVHRVERRRERL